MSEGDDDNPVIKRIMDAEAEAKVIIEVAEREAAETLRQARIKAQQIADEPIEVSVSSQPASVKAQIEAINAENEKSIASMREAAAKKRCRAADFIVSLVMEE